LFKYSDQRHYNEMANQQPQQQSYIRNQYENGMNEYERITVEWNQSNEVKCRRRLRSNTINNTAGYQTGRRIHHLRTIQVPYTEIWNDLFRYENLNPTLREYVQASIAFAEDATNTLLFAGNMDVSLIMQENYRPGVHVAIFIVQLAPHRHFHDGHVIQREFSEGSFTHQTINRLFNTDECAVVTQATEYSILEYLADDDEMLNLLHYCFMDPDFCTMRFSYIPPENPEDNEDEGQYVIDPDAHDIHHAHDFNGDENNGNQDDEVWNEIQVENDNQRAAVPVIAFAPPHPVNDFAAIYQYYYNLYQEDPMYNIINYNEYDIRNQEDDDELPAQG